MKAYAALWPPPDKEKAAQGENLGGPENPELGGTGETKVTPIVAQWQQGIPPALLKAIRKHRLCNPLKPLPAQLQRRLAREIRDRREEFTAAVGTVLRLSRRVAEQNLLYGPSDAVESSLAKLRVAIDTALRRCNSRGASR